LLQRRQDSLVQIARILAASRCFGDTDFVSVNLAKFPETLDIAAWCDEVSGSMAVRGVADITSKISIDEDDEASLWRENQDAGVEYSGQWLAGFTELSQRRRGERRREME
jgi:hypothetical protein